MGPVSPPAGVLVTLFMKSPSEPSLSSSLTTPRLQEAPGSLAGRSVVQAFPTAPASGSVHWFARLQGGQRPQPLLQSAWLAGCGCLSGTCPLSGGCPLQPPGRCLWETCGGACRASQAPSVSWRTSSLPPHPASEPRTPSIPLPSGLSSWVGVARWHTPSTIAQCALTPGGSPGLH